MFPRRIGNRTNFFFLFFLLFLSKPFHGQFSQDDPIIILQRRLPPPSPMGGLFEGKKERKRKEKATKIWQYIHSDWTITKYTRTLRTKPNNSAQ